MTNPTTPPLPSGDDLSVRLGELLAKATSGPWQNGIDDLDGVVSVAPVATVGDGNVVCLPPAWGMTASRERWLANAALIVEAINALPQLLAERAALNVRVEEARGTLERIAEHDVSSLLDAEIAERISWIEAELAAEPYRTPYGDGDEPPCRNGYEVTELVAERASLIARAYLTKEASDGR